MGAGPSEPPAAEPVQEEQVDRVRAAVRGLGGLRADGRTTRSRLRAERGVPAAHARARRAQRHDRLRPDPETFGPKLVAQVVLLRGAEHVVSAEGRGV